MYTMQSHSYQLVTLPLPQYPAGANSPWLSGLSHSDINSYHGRWFSRPIRSFCSFSAVRSKSGSVRGLAASVGYPLICGKKTAKPKESPFFLEGNHLDTVFSLIPSKYKKPSTFFEVGPKASATDLCGRGGNRIQQIPTTSWSIQLTIQSQHIPSHFQRTKP